MDEEKKQEKAELPSMEKENPLLREKLRCAEIALKELLKGGKKSPVGDVIKSLDIANKVIMKLRDDNARLTTEIKAIDGEVDGTGDGLAPDMRLRLIKERRETNDDLMDEIARLIKERDAIASIIENTKKKWKYLKDCLVTQDGFDISGIDMDDIDDIDKALYPHLFKKDEADIMGTRMEPDNDGDWKEPVERNQLCEENRALKVEVKQLENALSAKEGELIRAIHVPVDLVYSMSNGEDVKGEPSSPDTYPIWEGNDDGDPLAREHNSLVRDYRAVCFSRDHHQEALENVWEQLKASEDDVARIAKEGESIAAENEYLKKFICHACGYQCGDLAFNAGCDHLETWDDDQDKRFKNRMDEVDIGG